VLHVTSKPTEEPEEGAEDTVAEGETAEAEAESAESAE
jgi:hypothetical protein